MASYNEAKCLITAAVFEDDAIVYVKRREKRTCGTCFWMMSENACTPWMRFTKTWNLYVI